MINNIIIEILFFIFLSIIFASYFYLVVLNNQYNKSLFEKDCDYQSQQIVKQLESEGHNAEAKLVWVAHVVVNCSTCGMYGQVFDYNGKEINLADYQTNYREVNQLK